MRYRRYGYLRLHVFLRQEGLVINAKRTYRLYCAAGAAAQNESVCPQGIGHRLRRLDASFNGGLSILSPTPCGTIGGCAF